MVFGGAGFLLGVFFIFALRDTPSAQSPGKSVDAGFLSGMKYFFSTPTAICAMADRNRFRNEVLATLRHYDYSTPNISEFFHAAIAAAVYSF